MKICSLAKWTDSSAVTPIKISILVNGPEWIVSSRLDDIISLSMTGNLWETRTKKKWLEIRRYFCFLTDIQVEHRKQIDFYIENDLMGNVLNIEDYYQDIYHLISFDFLVEHD